jgi:hypothetical protein
VGDHVGILGTELISILLFYFLVVMLIGGAAVILVLATGLYLLKGFFQVMPVTESGFTFINRGISGNESSVSARTRVNWCKY